ncbi:lipid-A-disaccharide synthase [Campylobacter sp. MIT 21-1685]|uniref:lipid-A-disaccharide synthase n=1 Tax=unclassified Campylobacter TaxID=2593542 RepID=UPI00224A765D|nr:MULTISPECIES: lipid-A-disaccharide synthase [unclassified Campylobacter]MCX2682618.1 lipid-A-disaccharide synthase [Campylobacter sp. MIT 21-1684]MCX2750898.1 lipid-A-disaccharide synthase [Campylobacter sp. MIT 21-1682]MCX2807169.1 lipid-A-disaccharide synthase [Campylobacter sp. MIT 21-1685]
MRTFFVCALEPSANLHLKEVLKVYQKEYGNFSLLGIYDEALCKEFNLQTKPFYSSHEFSAMGFVEVLPLIFKAKRAIAELTAFILQTEKLKTTETFNSSDLKQSIDENLSQSQDQNINLSHKINAVLCIDSPAFNIPFAKALKKAGSKIKRIYYIVPQVWAWKKGRIPIIESHFDVLASILPFEKHFFSKSIYVGHPLLDEIKEFKAKEDEKLLLSKKENEKIIAFLPGSRKAEIQSLMPIFRVLSANFKGKKILCVPPFHLSKLEIYGDLDGFILKSDTPKVLKEADFAFICSGTATLEAALVGTPFVLCYKARTIDILIARLFVKLKHIGLANIICDFVGKEPLHPEFLQQQVNIKKLQNAYDKYDYKGFFAKVDFLKTYLQFGSARKLATILHKL